MIDGAEDETEFEGKTRSEHASRSRRFPVGEAVVGRRVLPMPSFGQRESWQPEHAVSLGGNETLRRRWRDGRGVILGNPNSSIPDVGTQTVLETLGIEDQKVRSRWTKKLPEDRIFQLDIRSISGYGFYRQVLA